MRAGITIAIDTGDGATRGVDVPPGVGEQVGTESGKMVSVPSAISSFWM